MQTGLEGGSLCFSKSKQIQLVCMQDVGLGFITPDVNGEVIPQHRSQVAKGKTSKTNQFHIRNHQQAISQEKKF
ncbi:UNVERIFIED_CONTAM: hypothetical protein FKN15_007533 [Acipenser sinensis]